MLGLKINYEQINHEPLDNFYHHWPRHVLLDVFLTLLGLETTAFNIVSFAHIGIDSPHKVEQ